MTSALALAIYGQRGDGFVECENLKIQIASLLEAGTEAARGAEGAPAPLLPA
jgi:hypothetical protein